MTGLPEPRLILVYRLGPASLTLSTSARLDQAADSIGVEPGGDSPGSSYNGNLLAAASVRLQIVPA